jgi:hypothetical protein
LGIEGGVEARSVLIYNGWMKHGRGNGNGAADDVDQRCKKDKKGGALEAFFHVFFDLLTSFD